MKIALVVLLVGLVGFAGGWLTRSQTAKHCYVLPAYTETSNSLLPDASHAPELVCR